MFDISLARGSLSIANIHGRLAEPTPDISSEEPVVEEVIGDSPVEEEKAPSKESVIEEPKEEPLAEE